MIHIALDTNIYRKNPRLDSPEFKAIVFLAKNKCICLHIPFFVENEFKSHIEAELEKRIDTVISALNKICNFTEFGPKTTRLRDVAAELIESRNKIVCERGDAFIKWTLKINAKRYTLSEEETNDALSAYFHGTPPLKEPKVRKDIPDSFIFQSLLRINKKTPLHVVIEDNNLRDACENVGIKCYSELASFIESEEVKTFLQGKIDSGVLNAFESQIVDYLSNSKNLLLDKIEEKLLSDEYSLISGDFVPGESNEIYISGKNRPHEIILGTSIEHYGDGLFVVDFEAKVEFVYEYAVYKTDAMELDLKKYYLEYLNDHYFNVETTDEFKFTGRIELDYDIDFEAIESVSELLQNFSEPIVEIGELYDFEINA